jgi:hypothetical protein
MMSSACTALSFARPASGELATTFFGRVQARAGYALGMARNQWLFGRRAVVWSQEVTGYWDQASLRLLTAVGLDVATFARDHTLLLYYTAFRSRREAKRVLRRSNGSPAGLHTSLGICASRVARPAWFQYCPECWALARATLGFGYIHRLFQVPGVVVCPWHSERLLLTSVATHPASRHVYPVVDENGLTSTPVVPDVDVTFGKAMAFLAVTILQPPVATDHAPWDNDYRCRATALGYGVAKLRMGRLIEEFCSCVPY